MRFRDDRFDVPRLDTTAERQLILRRLPLPEWDVADRTWTYGEEADAVRAVRFLHEGLHVPLDEAASERLEALTAALDLRSDKARRHDLFASLRPYQHEGVEFAVAHKRVLIADAMGLGKTLQALASLERLEAFPAVVLCPAAVKFVWQQEVLKWTPWRSIQVVQTGADDLLDVDLTVLNPELLPSLIEDLDEHGFRGAVLDEAHFYKNPRAQRTNLAEVLVENLPVRIGLTGTPIPNRRDDLIQQLRLLDQLEEVLHPYRGVLPHWWTPEQGPLRHDHAQHAIDRLPRDVLHARLRDVCMIRRTKWDVARDLPAFERVRRELPMEDRSSYQAAEKRFVDWVETLRERDEKRLWGQHLFQGRKHLSRLRREAALGKIGAVVDWATTLTEGRERAVLFAYHKAVVQALAEALPGRTAVITGDTNPHQRRVFIDDLGRYDHLVATMDSLGHGVDGLQHHANHVAFVELDWTPTKHEQCEGRLHRIGQKQPVTAWYFTAADTIEGAMLRTIDAKWADVQGIVDGRPPDGFLQGVVDGLVSRSDASA